MNLPFSIGEPRALILLVSLLPVVAVGVLSARARRRDRKRIIASTAVRCLILVLVVFALAGLQFISAGGPLNVVFLIDESASVPQESRDAAYQYVRQAIASMGPNDRAAVVLFGERAIVDRALSADTRWQVSGKHPAEVATDIAGALQVASALFPEGGAKRIILLSDGVQTAGSAADVARRIGLTGTYISVVPLGVASHNEVAVDHVIAPPNVHSGEQYEVRVLLKSTSDRQATVSLYDGDRLVEQKDAALKAGDNVVDFGLKASDEGFHALRAEVASVDDRYAQNNRLWAFTMVSAPPRVLIVAGTQEDAEPLKEALAASGVQADVVDPLYMPHQLENLARYDAVVLANASAERVGVEGQQALQRYVRDLGHGLLMIGGEVSFGAGGYLRSPLEEVLPVSMDVRATEQRASVAITFLVDKSGSMGRCHCGGAQQFSPTMRTEFGVSKVEIVKDAIYKAAALLNSTDQVGVVAYDAGPHQLLALAPMGSVSEEGLHRILDPMIADGETNMHAGLDAAIAQLSASSARLKHIILFSDGWTRQGEFSDLLNQISARHITLSTIGVGEGPGELLKTLAEQGGGRYYQAEDVNQIPDIVLKETVRLIGSYYVELRFRPVPAADSPILRGLEPSALPDLLGYNSTTAKPSADVILKSPRGDPILAAWQYGLGRSVAWTPDAKGRWAIEWVRWPQFSQFVGQMVGWTLPRDSTPGLESTFSALAGSAPAAQDVEVRVESTDAQGAPRNFLRSSIVVTGTGQLRMEGTLVQQSPGVYQGVVKGLREGVYEAYIEQRDPSTGQVVASQHTGIVVPYPGEYRLTDDAARQADALMNDIAQLGHGGRLDFRAPGAAFTHDIAGQPMPVPLWPWLLLAAVLLFPLDVAVRRLTFSRADLLEALRDTRLSMQRHKT